MSAMRNAVNSDASLFLRVCAKSLPRASYCLLGRMWYQLVGISEAWREFFIMVRRGFGTARMSPKATFGSLSELEGRSCCCVGDAVRCGELGVRFGACGCPDCWVVVGGLACGRVGV